MFSDVLNPPFLIAILIALTVHEWAHGCVAYYLGDPTAKDEGRLTLNPIAHLDPVGTLMFFLVHFGWGKPVPVNPRYFKHIRRDTALVAIAGPVSNALLAILSFILLRIVAPEMMHVTSVDQLLMSGGIGKRLTAFFVQILTNSLFINLGLMAFNLLPIAPLDGSKILQAFVPARYEHSYDLFMERGPMILLTLLILEHVLHIPILLTWVSMIMNIILNLFSAFL